MAMSLFSIESNEWMLVGVPGTSSGTTIMYNAFTGEWYNVPQELPDLYSDYYQQIARSDWTVQYSPDLEWAVYLTDPSPPEYLSSIVVWNLLAQEAIWQQQASNAAYYPPEWSSSRQIVALPIEGVIHLLDQNGLATKLAGVPELEHVQSLSWSPDERYLAYWTEMPEFSTDPYKAKLFVFDRQTRKVIDYCLHSTNYFRGFSDAAWSPDSQQFVIRGVIVQADGTSADWPVLVDVIQEKAVQISENWFAGFWLRSTP